MNVIFHCFLRLKSSYSIKASTHSADKSLALHSLHEVRLEVVVTTRVTHFLALVSVEIADSTPSPPAVKEVSKRFPSSDSPQSTEPAWLALAKRKAKAWSDCPQIIK